MNIDDIRGLLRDAERLRPLREEPSVVTGSLGNFVKAVEKRVGSLKPADTVQPPVMATFMGIDVREDVLLPANRAVLKLGQKVVAVIDLD